MFYDIYLFDLLLSGIFTTRGPTPTCTASHALIR